MTSDLDLLRQFARENSQDAFGEIVRRHLNLVYSAALRQVRSRQLAEEIAQSVFADLARDATKLQPDTILAAWLYAVTRRTAIDVIRKESRRQLREQIAVEMSNMNATANEWMQIEPLLDEAMAALDETDRSAVLLRYFENKSLREVGDGLKISEAAAQKRVSRAMDRLREFFSKRNIIVGASGLAILISVNAVQSAPVGLALTISSAALAGTAVSASTAIATTKVIAMTTLQKSIIGTAIVAAIGAGIFEVHHAAQLREQNQALQQQETSLADQNQQVRRELNAATNRLAALLAENEQLESNQNEAELLKLRGEVGILRTQLANGSGTKTKIEQPPLSSAQEYWHRAMDHNMNHEYEAEFEDLSKAIKLDPSMADAYLFRAPLYVNSILPNQMGGYEKAVADYTSLLAIKPNDAGARWNRATYYTILGKYDAAISDWTTYIEGDTDLSHQAEGKAKSIAGAYFCRGQVYQSYLHDYSRAIADYTAALQLNPNMEDAHRLRGQCYESLGETEKAQQDFAIDPKRN